MTQALGPPSDKPCLVCYKHDENQLEASWFLYTVCKKHRWVPAAYLQHAKYEYEALGFTEWDTKDG